MPSEEAKAKQRERMRLWREANKEKRAEYMKAWKLSKADQVKAYNKDYREHSKSYREYKLAAGRKYYQESIKASPEKIANRAKAAAEWSKANRHSRNATAKKYKAAHAEEINKKQREAYQALSEQQRAEIAASRREYQKQYRKANAEKLRDDARRRYEANRDTYSADAKAYYEKKRDAFIARAEKRQRKLSERGKYTGEDVQALYVKQCGRCAGCHLEIENTRSRSANRGFEVDHVMPVNLGGSNLPENLQLLCRPCNRKKHAKHPDEWARIAENLRIKNALCHDSKPTPNSTATTTVAPPASALA
jgi:5-methylcytosine-specific restriction endonuclease McrA